MDSYRLLLLCETIIRPTHWFLRTTSCHHSGILQFWSNQLCSLRESEWTQQHTGVTVRRLWEAVIRRWQWEGHTCSTGGEGCWFTGQPYWYITGICLGWCTPQCFHYKDTKRQKVDIKAVINVILVVIIISWCVSTASAVQCFYYWKLQTSNHEQT